MAIIRSAVLHRTTNTGRFSTEPDRSRRKTHKQLVELFFRTTRVDWVTKSKRRSEGRLSGTRGGVHVFVSIRWPLKVLPPPGGHRAALPALAADARRPTSVRHQDHAHGLASEIKFLFPCTCFFIYTLVLLSRHTEEGCVHESFEYFKRLPSTGSLENDLKWQAKKRWNPTETSWN